MNIRFWGCLVAFVVTMTLTACSTSRKVPSSRQIQGPASQIIAVTVANSGGQADDTTQWQIQCGEFPPNIVNCSFKRSDWTYWSGPYGGGSTAGNLLAWVVDPSSGVSYQIQYTTTYQANQAK